MRLSKDEENNTEYCWVERCHFVGEGKVVFQKQKMDIQSGQFLLQEVLSPGDGRLSLHRRFPEKGVESYNLRQHC